MPSAEKIAKYKQLLVDLLPFGRLWDVRNQPVLSALLGAMAPELARADDRIQDMLREADPRQTFELLEDWQRLLGLPDECTPLGATLEEQRNQVVQKYTSVGGISGAYYEFLTAQLGFPSVVTKPLPFRVGRSRVGDALTNDFDVPFTVGMPIGSSLHDVGWLFYFNVDVPASAAEVFEVGSSTVGEPLRSFHNELIECTIKKLKPAHAGVTFTFTD